jgi:C-terminal processing protease CtpA/Prc
LAVLVNARSGGGAEALSAVLRYAGVALLLGGKTSGQAMVAEEYPLKNGSRLRVASSPVRLGDGTDLSQGVKPDITVDVNPQDERAYFADAFKDVSRTNLAANSGILATNQANGTNRTRRVRFNEAELVREKRDGFDPDTEPTSAGSSELEKPVVRDPALARALDVLKGLAVIRQSRS